MKPEQDFKEYTLRSIAKASVILLFIMGGLIILGRWSKYKTDRENFNRYKDSINRQIDSIQHRIDSLKKSL
jgi:hypothetical protein